MNTLNPHEKCDACGATPGSHFTDCPCLPLAADQLLNVRGEEWLVEMLGRNWRSVVDEVRRKWLRVWKNPVIVERS